MLGSDVVRGMIKLYLNGYLSYDEITDWARNKCRNSELVMGGSDKESDTLFDILSRLMHGQHGQPLGRDDFYTFLRRLDAGLS